MSYLYKDVDANRQLYTSAYQDTDGKPTTRVNIGGSDYQAAVDIQNRYQKTIKTQDSVTVAANQSSVSSWFDTNGFDKFALTLKNDAAASVNLGVHWSNDGASFDSEEVISNSTSKLQYGLTETKARYFRVFVTNKDTVGPHTISVWAYLKV